jgi:hypothetical protein
MANRTGKIAADSPEKAGSRGVMAFGAGTQRR